MLRCVVMVGRAVLGCARLVLGIVEVAGRLAAPLVDLVRAATAPSIRPCTSALSLGTTRTTIITGNVTPKDTA